VKETATSSSAGLCEAQDRNLLLRRQRCRS
jgi:hypothetical protein